MGFGSMHNYKEMNRALTDSFAFLSTDNFKDLMRVIETYPIATNESNMELLRAYRIDGDQDALDLLIKTNIRLLLSKAKIYEEYATSYEILDLVNEAVIALIESANTYDFENANYTFTTHLVNAAKFKFLRILKREDKIIRRPSHIAESTTSYKRLADEYELQGKKLDDEEAKARLNITEESLKKIKSDYKYTPTSINAKVSDDEDSTELSNFIPTGENESDNVLAEIYDKELQIFLKRTLSDFQYYVIMMRIFAKKTYAEIGNEFALTYQRIEQIEKKALEKIKQYCVGRTINYRLNRDEKLDILRGAPIYPADITKYMYYRELLVEKERELFKLYIKGEYEPNDYLFAHLLKLNIEEYQRIKRSLFRKLKNPPANISNVPYGIFYSAIMKTFGTKIYSIDWDMNLSELRDNIKYISSLWENQSYDKVIKMLNSNKIPVDSKMDNILRKYFNTNNDTPTYGDLRKAEQEINGLLFGLRKKVEIPLDKLYNALENNKDKFTEEQYDYLMMRLFNMMPKKVFKKKYPNTTLLNGTGIYIVNRLESLYFNIADYKELNFTKNKYLQIRQQCIQILPAKQVEILDLYFGYKGKKQSVYGIQKTLGLKYEEARDKLSNAKSAAQSIFLNRSSKKIIETDYYIPYILDENCDLNDIHRKLLKGYLIDKKTYDELSKEYKLSKHEVSSNILDALMKIDFYRFNILRKYKYPKEISLKAIKEGKYTDKEREILLDLLNGLSRNEVAEKHHITIKTLENLSSKQTALCHNLMVKNITPSKEEIEKELTIHKAANLLNENERLILAYTYGIKCDINPQGTLLSKEEFNKRFSNLSSRYNKLLTSAIGTVVGKKLGIDHATLDIVDRDTLKRSLQDPRIPITDKERELLCYTYELKGKSYKDLNELAILYGERATSIKRRIQRAIVTINKYENGELQAIISYEYDVENNLKYFSKSDREILKEKYRDNLTYDEIAKKNNLTSNQVEKLLKRLDSYLRDILDD